MIRWQDRATARRGARALIATAALAAAGLAGTAPSASATTFRGSCELTGTLTANPAFRVVPTDHDFEIAAGGTCTGELDRRAYDGPAHVYLDGRMGKPMSCAVGVSNGVPGTMTFDEDPRRVDATRLDLIMDEFHVGPNPVLRLIGAYNGQAIGRIVFDVAPQEAAESCLGEGLGSAPIRIEAQTLHELYG